MDTFEDELHNLMTVKDPPRAVRKGIIRTIKEMARQVHDINTRALDGNLFSRIIHLNVFYLGPLPQAPEVENSQKASTQETEQAENLYGDDRDDSTGPKQQEEALKPPTPLMEAPDRPALSFSRYTLTTGHELEVDGRIQPGATSHLDLVRGDEGVDEN